MLNPGCKILGFFQQEKREVHSRTCPLKKANAASGNENGCVKLRAHAYKLDVYHCVNQNEIFTLLTSSIVHAKWKERGCWDTFAGLHLIGLQEYRVKWNDGRSVYTIRDFKIRERRRRRTSLKKRNSHYLNLHREYSYLLVLSNVGHLPPPPAPPPPPKKNPEKERQFRWGLLFHRTWNSTFSRCSNAVTKEKCSNNLWHACRVVCFVIKAIVISSFFSRSLLCRCCHQNLRSLLINL